jgi:hypothetical protein
MALCVGAGEAMARVEAASLPLVRRNARGQSGRVAVASPLSEGESAAWAELLGAFRG